MVVPWPRDDRLERGTRHGAGECAAGSKGKGFDSARQVAQLDGTAECDRLAVKQEPRPGAGMKMHQRAREQLGLVAPLPVAAGGGAQTRAGKRP